MIGGIEFFFPTTGTSAVLTQAVQAIARQWPAAVIEDGLTGEHYPTLSRVPFDSTDELFVYRDQASADLWDEHGAVEEAQNGMIHLIRDADQLTVVIDKQDANMDVILAAVKSAVTAPKTASNQKESAA